MASATSSRAASIAAQLQKGPTSLRLRHRELFDRPLVDGNKIVPWRPPIHEGNLIDRRLFRLNSPGRNRMPKCAKFPLALEHLPGRPNRPGTDNLSAVAPGF